MIPLSHTANIHDAIQLFKRMVDRDFVGLMDHLHSRVCQTVFPDKSRCIVLHISCRLSSFSPWDSEEYNDQIL